MWTTKPSASALWMPASSRSRFMIRSMPVGTLKHRSLGSLAFDPLPQFGGQVRPQAARSNPCGSSRCVLCSLTNGISPNDRSRTSSVRSSSGRNPVKTSGLVDHCPFATESFQNRLAVFGDFRQRLILVRSCPNRHRVKQRSTSSSIKQSRSAPPRSAPELSDGGLASGPCVAFLQTD